jgi:hypothetical protein
VTRGTALRLSNAATIRPPDSRGITHQPRRNPHTAIGWGIQAGGQSATPTSDAHVRRRRLHRLARLPALKRLEPSIVTGSPERKPSDPAAVISLHHDRRIPRRRPSGRR